MKGINPKLKLYCPVWHSRIRRTKVENINSLRNFNDAGKKNDGGTSIRSGSFCVIGELHDWTPYYLNKNNANCAKCTSLSMALMDHAYSPETIMDFQSDINQLVNHIEKDHPEIVEKRCVTK